MPTYEVEIPGSGKYRVESPTELSDAEVYQHADMSRMADPTTGMGTMERFTAAYGGAAPKLWQGIKQGLHIGDQKQLQQEVDETRKRDAPLLNTTAGAIGNFAGNAAPLVGASLVPGMQGYAGAAGLGALSGYITPTATGESRGANTAVGAGAGLVGQGLGNAVGRVLRPVASRLGPEESALAQTADREGIPLTAGQRTGSRPVQIAESVMENLPFTSAPQLAKKEAQQRAFTSAALGKAGVSGDTAGAAELLGQKRALGGTMNDITERNSLDFSKGLSARLQAIKEDAAMHLPPDDAAKVAGTIKKILSGAPAGTPEQTVASRILDESGQPFTRTVPATSAEPMAGSLYSGWREPLRGLSDNTATGRYYGQVRRAMDDAFRTQLAGTEGETYRQTSRQYANLKTIIDAMGGPGTLPAKGQIAPSQLASALARSVGRENKALGVGDMNELAKVGQLFVKDQIPNSGTAQRQIIQSLLTAGGGSGVGAAAAAGTGHDPLQGAMYGAGITGAGLAAPRLAQALMNSKAGQSYLTKGLVNLSPTQRAAIANALRSGAIAATHQ